MSLTPAQLPENIASIAEGFVGRTESPLGSNKGPELQEFFDADNYDPNGSKPGDNSYAWCAAFVCRVVQLAMRGKEWSFRRPRTPGAWAFEEWSLSQDDSTHTLKPAHNDIQRGDIVIFCASHIGIALSSPDKQGMLQTCEGNTNSAGGRDGIAVLRKRRHYSSFRSRIRFTV